MKCSGTARKRNTRSSLRAGVSGGDATALSCYFFEPSALPLPWAFCRSPARQNQALSGAESVTGRRGDFPASRCFFCVAYEVSRGKTVPRNNGPKTPRHRVSVSRRYTDAIRFAGWAQTVLQRETGALRFWAAGRTGTVSYWRRKFCQKNLWLISRFSKHFGNIV